MRMFVKIVSGILLAAVIVVTDVQAVDAPYCGDLENVHDYNVGGPHLAIVEKHHFNSAVENLRHGITGSLGADLSYTLMMYPNHHRALAAFGKLSIRDKTLKPAGAQYSVGCFFDRAIRFKPGDGTVRMVYGNYLLKAGQPNKAIEQLQIAADLAPEDPTINYNLGLLYAQRKDYDQAKIYAKKAYSQGFPLPGLRNKLIEAKQWED